MKGPVLPRTAVFIVIAAGLGTGSLGATQLGSDSFSGASNGALNGWAGGAGWAAAWEVQNSSTAVPGYNVASASPLANADYAQPGSYAVGGYNWSSAGRTLDTTPAGPFAAYLSSGLIGASGQSLFLSVLMRRDTASTDPLTATLHPGALPAWWVQTPGVAVGYFGGTTWAVQVAGVTYPSTVAATTGQAALLVARIDFGAVNTVSFYVNPSASALPATPAVQVTTSSSLAFRSLAWYAGPNAGESSLDEIRFAASYAGLGIGAVAALPAPTNLTAVPGNGQVTLSWTAVASATLYNIYRSVNSVWQMIASVTSATFTDLSTINGTAYSYYVTAMNPPSVSAPSATVSAVPRAPAPAPNPGVGTNLSAIADYGRELPFVDVFKTARTWIPQKQGASWGQGPALATDANGWITRLAVGQYAETIMLDNALDDTPHFPAGQYTLLYDGQGTIAFDQGSATIVSQTPGRMVVNVAATQNGVFLMETATNPKNYLRNIRFIMPGLEATYQTQPFNPTFLARLKGYRVLRFMEWGLTNGSTVQNWTDRPLTTDYTWLRRGVPVETMIQLANTTGITPWFNIPAMATDSYVTQFAALVQQQLTSGLRFYVEYSNETWNGGFAQNAYVQSQGLAMGLSTDPTLAGVYYSSLRAVQIFSHFAAGRVLRVMGSIAANSWISDQLLGYRNAFASADALAIAPYFNCDDTATGGFGVLGDPATASQVDAMSPDQIIDIELAHIDGCAMQQMQSNSAVAQKYGLRMVAYEGGQSLTGLGAAQNDATMTSLFKAANRSVRMNALYTQYLANWMAAGGDVMVHFTDVTAYTKYGEWGSLEYQDQDPGTAPRYRALMNFALQHP